MTSRIYFRNLNYYTTEGELADFLQEYYPVNVLIPSYTIRFSRSDKHKPLGIAYAEFESQEAADRVVSEINGKPFKGRPLSVKYHVPFNPKPRKNSSNLPNHFAKDVSSVQTSGTPEMSSLQEEPQVQNSPMQRDQGEEIEPTALENQQAFVPQASQLSVLDEVKEEPAVSSEFIFLNNISYKVTDEDLREYFKDHHPTDIYIYKRAPRGRRDSMSFKRRRYVSALVRLNTSSDLKDVFEALKSQKLKGKRVFLRAAFLDKVEEVVKAAKEKEMKESSIEPVAEVQQENTEGTIVQEANEAKQGDNISQIEVLNSEDLASRRAVYNSEEQDMKESGSNEDRVLDHNKPQMLFDTETFGAQADKDTNVPTMGPVYEGTQEDINSQETRPIDGTIIDSYKEINNQ